MGFVCVNPAIVGLLFTAERLSEAISGWFMVGRTDVLGRRRGVIAFLGLNILAQTILIFCPWYYSRMAGYILYGIS